MKDIFSTRWWTLAAAVLLLGVLSSGVIYAQAGDASITVNACTDQNADGDCDDDADSDAPPDVEACLNDDTTCQAVPATFTGLDAGSYTVFLRFVGASQGYYPTTGSTQVDVADAEQAEVTLGAVYPVHPKGVAVHEQLNKVYVAFQGPIVVTDVPTTATTSAATQTVATKPYPFVAVIDGEADEVLYTIPGGEEGLVDQGPRTPNFAGIGREPWGVAVSGDGQFVYVGSFGDGLVSYIDPSSDTVVTNYFFGSEFQPTAPATNPVTGQVHFPDYRQGNMLILSTDSANPQVAAPFIELPPLAFSPFEMVTANTLNGYNFVTLRDAVQPNPFRIAGLSSADPFGIEFLEFKLPDGSSGPPHAIGLWQQEGKPEPRLFITYADDPRDDPTPPDYVNPNKLLVYGFPPEDPKNLLLRNSEIELGDYAEAGLTYDPVAQVMRGTYAGFAYKEDNGDTAACESPERGGTYTVDFDGGVQTGPTPNVVVGNPPLVSDALDWKNPFEIAVNSNNGKVYVTDRCWNEFPEGGQAGGGALLIFNTEGPANGTPTPEPTDEPQLDPITLAFDGPAAVESSETFSVTVEAQNVMDPGLYGVQFEINYDPALISASNLQLNPALEFVVLNNADNTLGKITVVASRQGDVPGLTGDVPLLTFDATAADVSDTAMFSFEDPKIGDSQADAFPIVTEDYQVLIGDAATPEPTEEPTAEPTEEPTAEPTEEPTAEPTEEPTAEPTEEPTAEPTEEPTAEPTEEPTAEPTEEPTAEPTEEPTPEPTEEPTAEPTEEPTAEPTEEPTAEPTEEPTAEPTSATVTGQVILAGRAGNDWSGASVVISDTLQSDTTDATGHFTIANVPTGAHSAISADADGYLSAACTSPTASAPETELLAVTLLSGDIDGDDVVDVTDATAVGLSFGETGSGLATDISRDGVVDIFDIILVSINFGESGPQDWVCQ